MDFNDIPLYSFTVNFELTKNMTLPYFKGNLIRGIFGNALKEITCKIGKIEENCEKCIENNICLYSYLFNGKINDKESLPKKYKNYANFPLSFSFFIPNNERTNFIKNELFFFDVNIIGKGINYLPYFFEAFKKFDKYISDFKSKGKFKFVFMTDNSANKVYFPDSTIDFNNIKALKNAFNLKEKDFYDINFITPTKITVKNKQIKDELNEKIFVDRIFEKIYLQVLLYGNSKEKLPPINEKSLTILEKNLEWQYIKHYSSRQNIKLNLNGFIGNIKIKINDKNILPYLYIGQIMQIGGYTTGGFGKFIIK